MTPIDVILWAVALLVVALVIAVIRTARKPAPRTHRIIESDKR